MSLHAAATADADDFAARLSDILDACVPGLSGRLRRGIDVLDIGAGNALVDLAAQYPASRFYGYETRADALDAARRTVARRRLANITLMRQDAAGMPDRAAYDLITAFDGLRRLPDPVAALAAIRRALRLRGVALMRCGTGNAALPWFETAGFARATVRRHPHDFASYIVAPKLAAAND